MGENGNGSRNGFSNGKGAVKWSFGDFQLDPAKHVVWHDDKPVDLPLKAVELLCLLVERRGDVVTKDEIWKSVWNDAFIEETNLTHNIYLLRKTFREYGAPDLIKTVPRRGYRFAGEISEGDKNAFVYERMTVTDTFVEETTIDDPATGRQTLSQRSYVSLIAAGVLIIVAAGLLGWYFAVGSEPKIASIAVLPFRSLNSDGENGHIGLGIADTLTTRLSSIKELRVRPTSAVMAFAEADATAAGRELGVDAVLEGTIYHTNEEVKVNARLVRTADSAVIWSGEFQKPDEDELTIQNEVALHIVDAISANLHEDERAAVLKNYTGSVDAFRLYGQGRFEWNKRNAPSMIEAQRLFRNAIDKDPHFALAYSGLADTLATGGDWASTADAAGHALEIDPNIAEAHATNGFVKMFGHWDWEGAENAFKRSIELNSGYATAHHWYATLLAIKGRNEEAKAEMQRAIDINPRSFNYLADMGQLYYFEGDNEKAKEYVERALELNPDFVFGHLYLHYIYLRKGDYPAAIEEMIKSDTLNDITIQRAGKSEDHDKRFDRYRNAFRDGGLRGYLDFKHGGKPTDPGAFYFFAMKHALLGENEAAIAYLERASEAKTFLTAFVKAEPIFDGLRNEPRYREVLKKMRLYG